MLGCSEPGQDEDAGADDAADAEGDQRGDSEGTRQPLGGGFFQIIGDRLGR